MSNTVFWGQLDGGFLRKPLGGDPKAKSIISEVKCESNIIMVRFPACSSLGWRLNKCLNESCYLERKGNQWIRKSRLGNFLAPFGSTLLMDVQSGGRCVFPLHTSGVKPEASFLSLCSSKKVINLGENLSVTCITRRSYQGVVYGLYSYSRHVFLLWMTR